MGGGRQTFHPRCVALFMAYVCDLRQNLPLPHGECSPASRRRRCGRFAGKNGDGFLDVALAVRWSPATIRRCHPSCEFTMRPDGPPSVQAHGENCTGFGSSSSSSSVLSALGIIIYGRRRRRRVGGGGDDTRRGGLGETGRAATLQHLSHRRLISLNVELTRTRGLCDIHTHTRAYTHVYTRTCAPPQTRVVPYCVD